MTQTAALLWTDGRYHLQAHQQLKGEWKLMRTGEDVSLEDWLAKVSICADETQSPILVHIFRGWLFGTHPLGTCKSESWT